MTLDEMLQTAETRRLTQSEIDAYCVQSGLASDAALDMAASAVARAYAGNTLGYTTCDAVMNLLFAYASANGVIPDFMFSVFQAFDAGEFYPDEIRDPSPEERFTRPQIAAILARCDAV